MKILQIAPQFPFPETDGGKTSIARITEYYTKLGHSVHLLCVCKQEPTPAQLEMAHAFTPHVTTVVADTYNSTKNMLLNLFSREPLYTWKLKRKHVLQQVLRVASEWQPDVVHADHTNTAPLAMHVKEQLGVPFGLRLHNVEWVIWQRYAETFAHWQPQHQYLQMQAKRLRAFETKAIATADMNFAITEQDKQRALELCPTASIEVVTAGVDLKAWQPVAGQKRVAQDLVLATTWDWVHNVHGVEWFVQKVLPLVAKEIPEVRLHLLGKNAPQSLRELNPELVKVHGFVDDIHTFLSRCGVYIAPLFVGSGIRFKILEAMAMELPVVATSVAAEGIGAIGANGLFVEDEAVNMAKNIINLIQQPHEASDSGKAARAYIEKHHTWHQNIERMAAAMERTRKS